MNTNQIIILIAVLTTMLFCLGFVKNKGVFLLKVGVRGAIGVVCVLILNTIFEAVKIPLFLGVNICSISTIGFLGLPGVALLYGIIATRKL